MLVDKDHFHPSVDECSPVDGKEPQDGEKSDTRAKANDTLMAATQTRGRSSHDEGLGDLVGAFNDVRCRCLCLCLYTQAGGLICLQRSVM